MNFPHSACLTLRYVSWLKGVRRFFYLEYETFETSDCLCSVPQNLEDKYLEQ